MPKAPPEDFVNAWCSYCNTEYVLYLGHIPKEDRDAWRMWYSISVEFCYLNSKAHALGLWLIHQQQKGSLQASISFQGHLLLPHMTARGKDKAQTAGQRLVLKLRREEHERQQNKLMLLRAAFGVPAFQKEQYELIEATRAKAKAEAKERGNIPGSERSEAERAHHLVSAELEKIIWGDVRPLTKAAIEKAESMIDWLVNAKRTEDAKREEAKDLARRQAEEAARAAAVENLSRKIGLENSHRRRLHLPLLPPDYTGDFKTHAELIAMKHQITN